MAKLSRDLATPVGGVSTLNGRETLIVSGALASLNAEIILAADGCSSFAVDLRGTFSGTFEVSGTVDGTNWTPIPVRPVNAASIVYVAAIAGTAQGVWAGRSAPYRSIRLRQTVFTSGSATATLVAGNGLLDDEAIGNVTNSMVTATGIAGAAVTLTLPAPGLGLRHYITYMRLTRFASATLTAAATPVIITTTNFPGAPAWSIPAEAALIGTVFTFDTPLGFPIASVAQNTATTIIAPVTASVIWRLTAGYHITP